MVFKVGSTTVIDNTRSLQNYTINNRLGEKVNVVNSGATGNITIDILSNSFIYYTQASTSNWALNFRGDANVTLNSYMEVGDSVTVTFISTQDLIGYFNSDITIDGTRTGVKILGPFSEFFSSGNTGCLDVYSYNIIKTAATPTYDVYLSRSKMVNYGEQLYTTAGTYSWICPEHVTSVDVVCVGGGGGGSSGTAGASGGGGGGLGYKNNIAVTPGTAYTVVVGAGGTSASAGSTTNGGQSYFISAATVAGNGGVRASAAQTGGTGGTYVGDGGGNGGAGGSAATTAVAGGGGGAGGYAGNGGAGSNGTGAAGAGDGGGGGGGGGGGSNRTAGAGGGVGLYGQGTNGDGGGTTTSDGYGGFGGSGGNNAEYASTSTTATTYYDTNTKKSTPGAYGGGGAGSEVGSSHNANGASGAVRIIWGTNRLFPSTNVGNY